MSEPDDRDEPVRAWRIRADAGVGWIRDVDEGGVTVTALEAEARQWADIGEAKAALRLVARMAAVPHRLVAGPATVRSEWGDPSRPEWPKG